mmetsp:Transcript_32704/g.81407  ORF Transcript_32704/g.81407 Transcript_32704/m.81407 type:complete len:328 (-) Transcript_32704:2154-3137(-)
MVPWRKSRARSPLAAAGAALQQQFVPCCSSEAIESGCSPSSAEVKGDCQLDSRLPAEPLRGRSVTLPVDELRDILRDPGAELRWSRPARLEERRWMERAKRARRAVGRWSDGSSGRRPPPNGSVSESVEVMADPVLRCTRSCPPYRMSLRVIMPTTRGQESMTSRWRSPIERKRSAVRRRDEFCSVTSAASFTYGRRLTYMAFCSGERSAMISSRLVSIHGRRKSSAVRGGAWCCMPAFEGMARWGEAGLCANCFFIRMVFSWSRRMMPSTVDLPPEARTGNPLCVVELSSFNRVDTCSTSATQRTFLLMTSCACSRSLRFGTRSGR